MQTRINRLLIATAIAWQLALPVHAQAQSSSLPGKRQAPTEKEGGQLPSVSSIHR